ncbi:MAG: hypothetical protein Q9209_004379 [Squamulea sp. 1 TL-2023]
MTIKAFLKKIATEREKAQKKQSLDKVAATSALTAADSKEREDPPSATPNTSNDAAQISQEASGDLASANDSKSSPDGQTLPTEAQKDVPQPSIETTEDRVREESFQEQAQGDGSAINQVTQQDGSQQPQSQQGMQMQGTNGGSMGFDGMNNGFPNMAFNNPGDFNAMMHFMPNNAMGAFPTMMGMPGMPGLGMDPMQAMSQGMFGGLGGPGMGMNGMNAGMGFPAGWNNGGFNGQQPGAWMSGQENKFNQNAYGGHANGMMGGSDFGANAGYAAGYNMPSHQGNFNQMNNHHQFPNHDFQSNGYHGQGFYNRGRGRGRGYGNAPRGRGGYNQVMNGNQTNNEPFLHQYPAPQFDHRGNSFSQYSQQSQDVRQDDTENTDVDDFGRIKRPQAEATEEQIAKQMAPGDADDKSPEAPKTAVVAEEAAPTTEKDERPSNAIEDTAPTTDPTQPNPLDAQESKDQQYEKEKPTPIETFVSDERSEADTSAPISANTANTMMPPPSPAMPQPPYSAASSEAPYEYGFRGRGGSRRLSRGSSDFRGVGRGRGASYLPNGITNHTIPLSQPSSIPMTAPTEPKGVGVIGAPKGPKAMRDGLPNTGIRGGRGFSIVGRASIAAHAPRINGETRSRSRSLTHSRSPSRHRSHHHRSRRHRSTSATSGSPDREERRRERYRRRSRKYEDEDEVMADDTRDSTRRSSHRRSRRDRDDDREDENHNSKDHRSHRSRRDRDRDRDRESTRKRSRTPTAVEEMNGVETAAHSSSSSRKRHSRHDENDEARRERKRSRRDHDSNHDRSTTNITERSSKSEFHTPRHENSSNIKPPTGPKAHQQPKAQQPAAKPDIDPHELERQARNKERLQKELQRREAMEGKGAVSTKQRGESKTHGGGGGGGRRVNYKFEDELEGGSKVEREREGGRWG